MAVATRRQQLRSALRRLRRLSGAVEAAVVVAGDFNELAGSALHGELQRGELEDLEDSWKFLDAGWVKHGKTKKKAPPPK